MGNSTRRKTKAQSKVARERPTQYRKDKTAAEKKKRAERNRARNAAKKKGKKVAGKDVGHKKPLSRGGARKDSNTKVQSRKSNRAAGGRMGKGKSKTRGRR